MHSNWLRSVTNCKNVPIQQCLTQIFTIYKHCHIKNSEIITNDLIING